MALVICRQVNPPSESVGLVGGGQMRSMAVYGSLLEGHLASKHSGEADLEGRISVPSHARGQNGEDGEVINAVAINTVVSTGGRP